MRKIIAQIILVISCCTICVSYANTLPRNYAVPGGVVSFPLNIKTEVRPMAFYQGSRFSVIRKEKK